VRPQEEKRLKKLADELDLDEQAFDYTAYSFEQIKEQMYRKACVKTEAMLEKELLIGDGLAEMYDATTIEDKSYVPSEYLRSDFVNMLVLSFNVHDYSLAKQLLLAKYKANMMPRSHKIMEANKHMTTKIRIVWFMGSKEATNQILRELTEKHNLRPRILRDSYFRRDFAHYYNGVMYHMSRANFQTATTKQSVTLETEQERIEQKMLKH
jgi:hypothetical protein